jgi:putative DNA primase/helicase
VTSLEAALAYAGRGWPVSPWSTNGDRKFPLTQHGHLDATVDRTSIEQWWERWPNAIPSIPTGEPSGIVALDIDIRPDGSGFDSLDDLGSALHPEGPTAHSPRGGCHVLFRWPGHFVKTSSGQLAPYLDVRGDGGSLILPPGPGRSWDPHLGPDTPLAPMPTWMVIAEPEASEADKSPRPVVRQPLSRYGEAALDAAVKRIATAPPGQQRDTLNREVFGMGTFVAGGIIPSALALEALQWAARQMVTYDLHRPWRAADLRKAVHQAFLDGLARPRRPNGRAAS